MEINQIEIDALKAGLGLTLELSSIGKSYAGRPVLNAIDLSVASGEFLSVIGRSGSGKTTLLRLIAGLEAADAGTLSYDRQAIRKEDIRILFQEARLLPWKTLLENVLLGMQGSKHELYKQGYQILAQVGLAGREHDWPQQLSGGQRQRVALARALIHRPRLLLLDEPFGALDALTKIEMHRLLESIRQQHAFTAILVTHDVSEAVALSDRIIYIRQGRIDHTEIVDLEPPRLRASSGFAAIEGNLLKRLFHESAVQY